MSNKLHHFYSFRGPYNQSIKWSRSILVKVKDKAASCISHTADVFNLRIALGQANSISETYLQLSQHFTCSKHDFDFSWHQVFDSF